MHPEDQAEFAALEYRERRKDRILRAVVVIYAGTDIIFRNTKADVEQIITTAFELDRNISKRVDNGE